MLQKRIQFPATCSCLFPSRLALLPLQSAALVPDPSEYIYIFFWQGSFLCGSCCDYVTKRQQHQDRGWQQEHMDRSIWKLLPVLVAASPKTNPVMQLHPLSKKMIKQGFWKCAQDNSLFGKHLGLVLVFCTMRR